MYKNIALYTKFTQQEEVIHIYLKYISVCDFFLSLLLFKSEIQTEELYLHVL